MRTVKERKMVRMRKKSRERLARTISFPYHKYKPQTHRWEKPAEFEWF